MSAIPRILDLVGRASLRGARLRTDKVAKAVGGRVARIGKEGDKSVLAQVGDAVDNFGTGPQAEAAALRFLRENRGRGGGAGRLESFAENRLAGFFAQGPLGRTLQAGGVVGGAVLTGGFAADIGGGFLDTLSGETTKDRMRAVERLEQGDFASAIRTQRLQRDMQENVARMTLLPPDLFNSIMAGRPVPKTGIMIGEPNLDVIEELAMAMTQGEFQTPPDLEQEFLRRAGLAQ